MAPAIVPVDVHPDCKYATDDEGDASPMDMYLFRESQAEAYAIFSERRQKYGAHTDNAKRFPFEDKAGLYLKCTRMIRMIESDTELDDDSLIDLANYCHLIRSARKAR